MMQVVFTIVVFLLVLIFIVFIHEMGHFLAARWCKMRVEQFSIGFGRRLWGFNRGGVEYCISMIPLGGYVKISGMLDEQGDIEALKKPPKEWEYRSKPLYQRAFVLAAGVLFNIISAVIIFTIMNFSTPKSFLLLENLPSLYIPENSWLKKIGFETGDKLLGINGEKEDYFEDILEIDKIVSDDLVFMVNRRGEDIDIPVDSKEIFDLLKNKQIPISPIYVLPPVVGNVLKDSPGDKAGIQKGDMITQIDGQNISYWLQISELLAAYDKDDDLQISLIRQDEPMIVQVTLDDEVRIGINRVNPYSYFSVEEVSYGLMESFGQSFRDIYKLLKVTIQGISSIFSGKLQASDSLSGPVGIAVIVGEATSIGGWYGLLSITAQLSVLIAFFNILPIPILDGGHLLFLGYEAVAGKPPDAKIMMVLQYITLSLLVMLFLFVTYNDVLRLF